MPMLNASHPGIILREWMGDDITVTALAKHLGITRSALSNILNGKAGVSATMAIKLEQAFPATDACFWVTLQANYELAKVTRVRSFGIAPLRGAMDIRGKTAQVHFARKPEKSKRTMKTQIELSSRISQYVALSEEGKTWWYHRGWLFLAPFFCMGCAKEVDARQWGFSRSCGPCDVSNSRTRRALMGRCFAGKRILIDPNARFFIPAEHFVSPKDADKYPILKVPRHFKQREKERKRPPKLRKPRGD